jgi:hypothetical protein
MSKRQLQNVKEGNVMVSVIGICGNALGDIILRLLITEYYNISINLFKNEQVIVKAKMTSTCLTEAVYINIRYTIQ